MKGALVDADFEQVSARGLSLILAMELPISSLSTNPLF
jgi:hypothetical protein